MKKIVGLILLCAMILSMVSLTACFGKNPEKEVVTRVTVDINPSIEFMVDDDNKVISVTALNDDGSILIAGEAFVGKTPEEAIELVITLATETGYLVKENAEVAENNVKISVSGDTKYAENLKKDITEKANMVMNNLNVSGKVEEVKALALEDLRKLASEVSLYTEEEINAMDEEQLYKVISVSRIETALLLTEEMRTAYYAAKDYKISFAESEEVARIIEEMGGLYAITHSAYKASLDMYGTAIENLDKFRYDMLVSPDSDYQKALAALRDSKAEFLKQRSYTASLEVNGEEYESATITLEITEENYERALAAFEAVGEQINASLENLINALKESESALRELEKVIFDENVEEKLKENATLMEEKLNEAKDRFFAEFESAHKDDISAMEQALIEQKEQLKADIDSVA